MIFYPKYNLWSDFQESNIFSNLYFFLKLYKTKFLLTNNVYLITQCNQLSFKRWCLLKKVNLGYQTDKYDISKVRKGSLFAKKIAKSMPIINEKNLKVGKSGIDQTTFQQSFRCQQTLLWPNFGLELNILLIWGISK